MRLNLLQNRLSNVLRVTNTDNESVKCPLEMLVEKLNRDAKRVKLEKEKARADACAEKTKRKTQRDR